MGNEISHDLLRRLRVRLKAIKPGLYLLGEIWHDAPAWLEGDEYDAVMHYPLQSALRRFFEDESQPAQAFGWDVARCMSVYAPQVNTAQFILLDSHDTIRLRSRVRSEDEYWQQLAALFTLPGSPCVYYGTEVVLEGGPDPDCRRCMPWDELDTPAGQASCQTLRALIALRRQEPALQGGEIAFLDGPDRLVRYRRGSVRPLEVCLNAGREPEAPAPTGEVLFARGWDGSRLAPGGVLICRV